MKRALPWFLSVAILSICAGGAFAQSMDELTFGPQIAGMAASYILNNPPLPMLYFKQGTYKLTVMPANYKANFDATVTSPGQVTHDSGKFTGYAAGAGFSYAFADRWGVYAMGIGSTLSGDYSNQLVSVAIGNTGFQDYGKNIQASFETLNVGLVHQCFGNGEKGFTLPVFAGFGATHISVSQNITGDTVNVSAHSATESLNFDMAVDHIFTGFFFGVEAGIPVGHNFQLNPFIIVTKQLGNACQKYTASNIQNDSFGVVGLSTVGCGEAPA